MATLRSLDIDSQFMDGVTTFRPLKSLKICRNVWKSLISVNEFRSLNASASGLMTLRPMKKFRNLLNKVTSKSVISSRRIPNLGKFSQATLLVLSGFTWIS